MSSLFAPITLRSVRIRNRVWMSPMCRYSAAAHGPEAGVPTAWHRTHLASRAVGGAGLVMAEATAVDPRGRISPFDLGLWNDRQRDGFAGITAAIAEHGAVPGIQLAHAGRKGSTEPPWLAERYLTPAEGGWQTAGPSPEAYGEYPAPAELTVEQIRGVVGDFAAAAERALAAGFRVVEVHGAHGYLIHSFLSPYSNRRTDSYGGSFAGRARLALEVVAAVREVWPDELPVFLRVSATDWLRENPAERREGWTVEDTIRLANEMLALGVDLLDVSSGANVPDARIPRGRDYQVKLAAAVRAETDLAVGAVGRITDPGYAEEIIGTGQADAVFLARGLLDDPYWPRHAARRLGVDPGWPAQYSWALDRWAPGEVHSATQRRRTLRCRSRVVSFDVLGEGITADATDAVRAKETNMRKLMVTTFVSLDGVVQAPGGGDEDRDGGFEHGGWTVPHFDEQLMRRMTELTERAGALLLGRRTYEIFAASWPLAEPDDPIGSTLNSIPKYVASRTLETVSWRNSTLLTGEVAEAVGELKRGDGGEIQVHGSGRLIQTLLEHDLVDEFHLIVFPVLIGSGKRLFGNGTIPAGLRLAEVTTSGTGVLLSTYTRAGTVGYGAMGPETGNW